MKKTFLALLIGSTLASCGGGGGGGGSVVTPPSSSLNPIFTIGSFDLTVASDSEDAAKFGDGLGFDIIAVGDVNSDGYDDLLLGVMRYNQGGSVARSSKPILLVYDTISKSYKVDTAFKSVANRHIWPRQGLIADLTGDGKKDIFIGDTGVDATGNDCGFQNSLVVNNGAYINATSLLPQVWDYSHGLMSADFNKDGINDLLILNQPYLSQNRMVNCGGYSGQAYTNSSVLLAGPNMAKLSFKLALDESTTEPGINFTEKFVKPMGIGTADDINGDGIPDVITGSTYNLNILESNAVLSYNKSKQVLIPSFMRNALNAQECFLWFNNCDTPYSFVAAKDLDGDGKKEIVAAIAYSINGTWSGLGYQILKNISGTWTDVTETIIPGQLGSFKDPYAWCYRMQFADLNGDGIDDIICNTLSTVFNKQILLSNGKGQFAPGTTDTVKQHVGNNRFTIVNLGGEKHMLSTVAGQLVIKATKI